MLKGPLKDVASNQTGVDNLLAQSKKLADNLKVAFDTATGIPDNTLIYDPKPRKKGSDTNGIATIGTLVLEWTRLSDLTGDKQYADLSQKGENFLLKPNEEVFPGLLGTDVFISNGTFADRSGGWNGGTDSFYEYLIKMWVYDQNRFSLYKERWIAAADSSIKFLASSPTTRPDLTFLAAYNNANLRFVSSHRKFVSLLFGYGRLLTNSSSCVLRWRQLYSRWSCSQGAEIRRLWHQADRGLPRDVQADGYWNRARNIPLARRQAAGEQDAQPGPAR